MIIKTQQKQVTTTETEIPIGSTFKTRLHLDDNEFLHVLNEKTIIKISYSSENKNDFSIYDLQVEHFKLESYDVPIEIVPNSEFLAGLCEIQLRIDSVKKEMMTAPTSDEPESFESWDNS